MTSDYELAKMLFPKPRDIVREATAGTPKTSQVRGVATGDSSDGSVTVILDTVAGGDNAEMTIPTTGGITEGADVIVTLLDGTPVEVDQPGSIDNANARIDVLPNQIISTVSQTYATKDEALNTASGSGRSITTTDAAGLPLRDLTVYGESVQDGTPTPDAPVEIRTVRGVNLAPELESRYTSEPGWNLWGTSSTVLTEFFRKLPLGEYTISFDVEVVSHNGTSLFFGSLLGNATAIMPHQRATIDNISDGDVYHHRRTFIIDGTVDISNAIFYFYASTSDAANRTYCIVKNLQLSIGRRDAPFVQRDSLGACSKSGANLADINADANYLGSWTQATKRYFTGRGVWPGMTANGYFNAYTPDGAHPWSIENGIITTYDFAGGYGMAVEVEVKPETSYTVSFESDNDAAVCAFGYYSSDGTWLSWTSGNNTRQRTVTTPANAAYMTLVFVGVASTTVKFWDIMLVEGTTTTSYEPYRESTTYIPLQGHALASLPDGTQDVLHVENGRAWIDAATAITTTATTDGITATVGVDAMSTTGDLSDGATVIYAATPSTIDLGEVSLPTVQDGDTVRIIAEVQPEFDTSWWRDTAIVGGMEHAQSTADSASSGVTDLRVYTDSRLEQTSRDITATFTESIEAVGGDVDGITERVSTIENTVKINAQGVTIAASDSPISANLNNAGLVFSAGDEAVLTLNAQTSTAEADRVSIGHYQWREMGDNAIALVWIGE